ncbi:MAG: sigma-54 dependent transcriptional regulator [Gemmataceae bacterium]|nr:sigma-54 dependent transcriptional regulator [Gemmataceae bacterium]
MASILLIDDEPAIRHAFGRAFRAPAFHLQSAATIAEGLGILGDTDNFDVVILDIHLPDSQGLHGFERVHSLAPKVPIILITGHGTTDLAIEAIKRGAYEYLLKPLELDTLRDLVARACASRRLQDAPTIAAEPETEATGDALVGRCPAMQEVYKAIGRVAPTDATVLILGASGTGKELVARAIVHHSRRSAGPFLAINCAAIPEALLESELFGHERGSFTGADRRRVGRFEQCDGGTLFLDEVGDMTPLTQTKVLRVLQEQKFERVGGSETIHTNVRIIAATNADLEKLVAAGQFRADLYYRLNVFTVRLPALADRLDDLDLLTSYFIRRFSRELGMTCPIVPAETLAALKRYPWPGNVRELQSVLKQSLLHLRGSVLLPEFLPSLAGVATPAALDDSASYWDRFVTARIAASSNLIYDEAMAIMEREVITRVLRATEGNQVQAAKMLGITRGSLRTKIRLYKISIGRTIWSEDEQDDQQTTNS